MLRIVGSPVFAHVNNGKLVPRDVKCMFLRYAYESKRHQLWCPDSKKVIQSRDVTFNESAILSSGKESVVSSVGIGDQEDASRKVEIEGDIDIAQGGVANHPSRGVQAAKSNSSTTTSNHSQVGDDYSIAHDRSRREIRKLAGYEDSDGLVAYSFIVAEEIPEGVEPSTYIEAISSQSSPNWVLPMQEEMKSLHKNRTWDLCELPSQRLENPNCQVDL